MLRFLNAVRFKGPSRVVLGVLQCHRKISGRTKTLVDRAKILQNLKRDDSECAAAMATGQFCYFHKNMPMLKITKNEPSRVAWISYEATHHAFSKMKKHIAINEDSVLLDVSPEGVGLFALQLYPLIEEQIMYIQKQFDGQFEDLRPLITLLTTPDYGILAKARSLLSWNLKTRFCSTCGQRNARNSAGSQRTCPHCHSVQYPVMSPVAIVVAGHGDQCLLVRQPRHPPGMYTAIAGFSEAGETIEETIHREVAEEVGLEVESIEYLSSQHWPFPISSLMLGCLVTVRPGQVVLDRTELEDARWVSADKVRETLDLVQKNPSIIMSGKKDLFLVPPPGPIANDLLTAWLRKRIG